jgi:methyl-accepting chemotaxis protein
MLNASLLLIAILVGGLGGLVGWRQSIQISNASEARERVAVFRSMAIIAQNLSSERGGMTGVLAAAPNSPAVPGANKTLSDNRAALDQAFSDFGAVVAQQAFADRHKASRDIQGLHDRLMVFRKETADAVALPLDQRGPLLKKLTADNLQMLTDIGASMRDQQAHLSTLMGGAAQMIALASTAWDFRDQAGRHATFFTTALGTGKPMTDAGRLAVARQQGVVDRIWTELEPYQTNPDVSEALRQATAAVAKVQIGELGEVRAKLEEGFATGTYFIDATEFRRRIQAGFGAINNMRDAAIAEAEAVVSAAYSTALWSFGIAVIAAVVVLAVVIVVAMLVRRRVTVPLDSLTGTIRKIADGARDLAVDFASRTCEMGTLAKAIIVLRDNAAEADRLAAEEAEQQKQKLLRQQRVDGFISRFEVAVGGVLGAMSGAAGQMQQTATQMSRTASDTNEQATTVAAASEQASTNVQTVAAASEELTSSIHEISRQVQESAEIALRATGEAERTASQVRDLKAAAERIGEVVKLINDIAAQTNLLALNATIEAARAGEAGKGFAVVANEVKNLASQTAKATEDISTQVAGVQAETATVVASIEDIGRTIHRMNDIASGVAAAVEEQGAATQEITRNVQQAAAGTQQVSASIVEVTQGARQTGEAAGMVLGASDELVRQGDHLRVEIEGFLGNIRAA